MRKILTKGIIALFGITALLCACAFEYDALSSNFTAVESVAGVPTGGIAGYELVLDRAVLPENATNKTVLWQVADDGGTNSVLNRNKLKAKNYGIVKVRATVKNGKSASADYIEDFEITIYSEDDSAPEGYRYTPVRSVSNIPFECETGTVDLSMAVVNPSNAVNKTIVWEVKSEGTTSAAISGDTLTVASAGTVVITATIAGGSKPGVDYAQDFTIFVDAPAVTSITGVPTKFYIGEPFTLTGTVNPSNAVNTTIVWTVKNANGTGAAINGNTLTASSVGTVIVTATVAGGRGKGADYARDFTLEALPPPDVRVYIVGYHAVGTGWGIASYYKDGALTYLPLPPGYNPTNTTYYASCITAADGSVYIGGCYNDHPCYWKGERLEFYDNNSNSCFVNGITVVGEDVYMSGLQGTKYANAPCYWKNGTRIDLKLPEDFNKIYINDQQYQNDQIPSFGNFLSANVLKTIVIDGSTLYIGVLRYKNSASTTKYCYWKITNGVQEIVTINDPYIAVLDGTVYSNTDIIVVSEGKLYRYGSTYYDVWNGTDFVDSTNVGNGCTINNITAYNGNVYTVFKDNSDNSSYKVNNGAGSGLPYSVSTGAAFYATGIAVVWE